MKTFYILYPGLHSPQDFEPKVAPVLLAQQDLWQASRGTPASLLFRVRTESNHGERFSEYDRLESCVGMIDSVTRWRGVFRHAGYALNAIRHVALAAACGKALQIVASQHPSSLSMQARRQMADEITGVAKSQDVSPFEHAVALHIAAVVLADNDVEAAQSVPFAAAFMPYRADTDEFRSRLATIETMAGAMLLTEAASRLAERVPEWLHAAMPAPLAAERPIGPRSDVSASPRQQEDDEGDEGDDHAGIDLDEGHERGDKPDGL